MLCVIPPNVVPSRDKLENSALNNPHGFGYAIAIPSEKRIHAFRTMNPDECINRFMEDRKRYVEGYAIWHARYATHGSNTIENCHPFKVGNELTYLAHNGIISVISPEKDDRSDTRIFAEDILAKIGGVTALDNPQVWNMLEDFTTGSKVAVLSVDPKAKHELYLLHADKGWEDSSGVWWSNNTCHLDSWYSKYGASTYASKAAAMVTEEDDYWLICDLCENARDYWDALKTGDDQYCDVCKSCWDCGALRNDCLCFQGSPSLSLYDNRTPESTYHDTRYNPRTGKWEASRKNTAWEIGY
jgi:glutamine amidotransferase